MHLISDSSPSDRRGEVASTFFIVGYVAISVPVIGMGSGAMVLGLRDAAITFCAVVAVVGIAALLSLLRRRGQGRR